MLSHFTTPYYYMTLHKIPLKTKKMIGTYSNCVTFFRWHTVTVKVLSLSMKKFFKDVFFVINLIENEICSYVFLKANFSDIMSGVLFEEESIYYSFLVRLVIISC